MQANGKFLSPASFAARRDYLGEKFVAGDFLKNPGQGQANPLETMGDPANMEVMMEGMKKNMFAFIPQTIIFGWINFFFSGFVLSQFPFPFQPLRISLSFLLFAG